MMIEDLAPEHAPRRYGRTLLRGGVAVVALVVLGNLFMIGLWQWQAWGAVRAPIAVRVDNFRVVDERLWRGAAPDELTYRDLAANGATTVIDLRAEEGVEVDTALLGELGLQRVSIPIRDGQAPRQPEVDRFLEVVAGGEGPVYVHCGAGVGRTGSVVATYLVATGRDDRFGA